MVVCRGLAVVIRCLFLFFILSPQKYSAGGSLRYLVGVGIVLTAVVSILVFKNKIDLPFVLGAFLIIAGVVVINLFSKTSGH